MERLDFSYLSKELKVGFVSVKDLYFLKKVKKVNFLEYIKYEYRVGDRFYFENDKIYVILRGIKELLKEVGYIFEIRFVFYDVD